MNPETHADDTELDDATYDAVMRASEAGERLMDEGQFAAAFEQFQQVWALLPEPKHRWDAALWVLAALGDAQFQLQRYSEATAFFQEALRDADGQGNPFIHLRLGECAYELGQHEQATRELSLAFEREGDALFDGEDPRYLAFLRGQAAPQPRA